MEIQVVCRSNSRKTIMEHCARFYAKELNLERSRYKLIVTTVSKLRKNHGCLGCAYMEVPGEITVLLDSNLGSNNLIVTLAHEMVHVKQLALGQLREVKNRRGKPTRMWRGKPSRTHALYSPWEREAYRRENMLVISLWEQIERSMKK